jgi:hypothetical protein
VKIVVIIAFWQRHEIAKLVFDHLIGITDYVRVIRIAVGSEGEASRDLAKDRVNAYVEFPNKPVGAKWNRVLLEARGHEPDAVMVLGSDNFITPRLMEEWHKGLKEGIDYQGLLDSHQYHLPTKTLVYWPGYVGRREGEPIGSARCFSAALLDRLDWRLWESSLNNSLDYSTTTRLKKYKHTTRHVTQLSLGDDVKHIGVKTKSGDLSGALVLNPKIHTERLEPERLIGWFGETGERILEL